MPDATEDRYFINLARIGISILSLHPNRLRKGGVGGWVLGCVSYNKRITVTSKV